MEKIIILRYGELHLKGKNKCFFENHLLSNIRRALTPFACDFVSHKTRYIVSRYDEAFESSITGRLLKVFGLNSLSVGYLVNSDLDEITEAAKRLSKSSGSFRVNTNRAEKRFPLTSMEVSKELGGRLLAGNDKLTVDLFKPDFTINVDIRENGKSYVFADSLPCACGLPAGTAGRAAVMLSGGIDSPVAAYMMAARGLKLYGVHFYSYPYTSEKAQEKVIELAGKIAEYAGDIKLFMIPFTKIQETINACCKSSYAVILLRRFMMRACEMICNSNDLHAIITGESLGQVASQTLDSINTTNAVVSLPVFRPLIGSDKSFIIDVAKKIGTYDTSILPYEDCCTVFLPENPVTRPKIDKIVAEEEKIPDYQLLLEESIANAKIQWIKG